MPHPLVLLPFYSGSSAGCHLPWCTDFSHHSGYSCPACMMSGLAPWSLPKQYGTMALDDLKCCLSEGQSLCVCSLPGTLLSSLSRRAGQPDEGPGGLLCASALKA